VLHPYSSRRLERHAGIEPASPVWKTGTLAVCANAAEWFPEGSNLAPADLHSAALPNELENLGREAGTRTPSAWSQTRSADPYATSRYTRVDRPGFEPGNLLLARELLYQLELAAHGAARPETTGQPGAGPRGRERNVRASEAACLFLLVFRCAVVNTLARSPRGVVLRMDGRNRTCNHWFWRPALSLVELRP
jgi:hypothetical protein